VKPKIKNVGQETRRGFAGEGQWSWHVLRAWPCPPLLSLASFSKPPKKKKMKAWVFSLFHRKYNQMLPQLNTGTTFSKYVLAYLQTNLYTLAMILMPLDFN